MQRNLAASTLPPKISASEKLSGAVGTFATSSPNTKKPSAPN